jgi:hypothetical protein
MVYPFGAFTLDRVDVFTTGLEGTPNAKTRYPATARFLTLGIVSQPPYRDLPDYLEPD